MINFLIFALILFGKEATYTVHTTTAGKITFHYIHKDEKIGTLSKLVKLDSTIIFAMNGSMYTPEYTPVGLYVEKGKVISKLKLLNNPKVNFGITPQAVLFVDKKGKAGMIDAKIAKPSDYYYAVQLAPMLLINGQVNPRIKDIKSKYKRNAMGITKQGRIVMVLSHYPVTFQELVLKLKALGCTSAAYVDGSVSEAWSKGDKRNTWNYGRFAVMVAAH